MTLSDWVIIFWWLIIQCKLQLSRELHFTTNELYVSSLILDKHESFLHVKSQTKWFFIMIRWQKTINTSASVENRVFLHSRIRNVDSGNHQWGMHFCWGSKVWKANWTGWKDQSWSDRHWFCCCWPHNGCSAWQGRGKSGTVGFIFYIKNGWL